MICTDKCREIGLPSSQHSKTTQEDYLIFCLMSGYVINGILCHHLGICDLLSVISRIRRKGYLFTLNHGKAYCPFTNKISPHPVDIIYMTDDQKRINVIKTQ